MTKLIHGKSPRRSGLCPREHVVLGKDTATYLSTGSDDIDSLVE